MSNLYIECDDPFQYFALLYVQNNFYSNGVKELTLIQNGVRLTDMTGAVADFVYNFDTGNIDFREVGSEQLRREAKRKKNVQLIQRDLLRSLNKKY